MSENQDDITDQQDDNDGVSASEAVMHDDNGDCEDQSVSVSAAENSDDNNDMELSEDDDNEPTAEENSEASNLITLDSSLDHDALNDLTQKILEHYKDNDSLELNISALEDVNTACVQAFISINRYAKTNDKSLKWIAPSNSFVDSFNTLGLYSEMMQMEMA